MEKVQQTLNHGSSRISGTADGLHHTSHTTPMTSLPQIPCALQSNIIPIPQQTEDDVWKQTI